MGHCPVSLDSNRHLPPFYRPPARTCAVT